MEEVRRFARTTTMKGIPRVIGAEVPCLRLLWTVGVLAFLTFSLFQTYLLVRDFLSYATIMQVKETFVNPLDPHFQTSIPEINLCNQNALSSNASRYLSLPTLEEFYNDVRNQTECKGCDSDIQEQMEQLRVELLNVAGYYKYLGRRGAARVGHSMADMVRECHVLDIDGAGRRKLPCDNHILFSYFQTTEYFRCINMKISPANGTLGIVGVSLVLYLDNVGKSILNEFDVRGDLGQSAGVVLSIQNRDVLPNMLQNTVELLPGERTNIRVIPEKRILLPPPYGTCIDDAARRDYLSDLGQQNGRPTPTGHWQQTFPTCLLTCLEKHTQSECGCISAHEIDLADVLDVDMNYCGDLTTGRQQALETAICAERTRDDWLGYCAGACPRRCTDYLYRQEVSSYRWPRRSRLIDFYDALIKGSPSESHFSIVDEIIKMNQTVERQLYLSAASEIIWANFLQVSIFLKDYNHIILEEIVKTTPEGLLSQLGGTLNLWSGISAIMAIEIIETCYRLCVLFMKPARKGNQDNCNRSDQERASSCM